MCNKLVVRAIAIEQVELFASIVREGAVWLQQQGRHMWEPEQMTAERMLQRNEVHEMFIGYANGEPAATVIIQETDRYLWPEESQRPDSLYVHKLCVRRALAKRGYSAAMIEWAKKEVQRRGKTYLRLDCAADRPKLCALYEQNGFSKVGERLVRHMYPTAFYAWAVKRKIAAAVSSAIC